jgi:hypothetical protein
MAARPALLLADHTNVNRMQEVFKGLTLANAKQASAAAKSANNIASAAIPPGSKAHSTRVQIKLSAAALAGIDAFWKYLNFKDRNEFIEVLGRGELVDCVVDALSSLGEEPLSPDDIKALHRHVLARAFTVVPRHAPNQDTHVQSSSGEWTCNVQRDTRAARAAETRALFHRFCLQGIAKLNISAKSLAAITMRTGSSYVHLKYILCHLMSPKTSYHPLKSNSLLLLSRWWLYIHICAQSMAIQHFLRSATRVYLFSYDFHWFSTKSHAHRSWLDNVLLAWAMSDSVVLMTVLGPFATLQRLLRSRYSTQQQQSGGCCSHDAVVCRACHWCHCTATFLDLPSPAHMAFAFPAACQVSQREGH